MNIQERFAKIFPDAKVYWNGNANQLSFHFVDCKVDEKEIEIKVYEVLSKTGLLRTVDSVRILVY